MRGREIRQGSHYGKGLNVVAPIDQLVLCCPEPDNTELAKALPNDKWIETPKGKAKVLVHLSEGIMPGVIGIPKGLGHTAYDDYLAGKGVNANSLMGVVEDPVSGLSATWGIRAKLTSV